EGVNGGARWGRGLAGGAAGGAPPRLLLGGLLAFRGTPPQARIAAPMALRARVTPIVAPFVNLPSHAPLEGSGPTNAGAVYHLGKFAAPHEAVVGSDKKAVVFIWVPGASNRHAGLSLTPAGCRLRALDPDARILVNGSPVTECLLRAGDEIEV